jgi:hypothetical protein
MKRFQMITEADARALDYGSTVVLVAGGHVTPLAQDTLKARRVSIVREGTTSTPSRWRRPPRSGPSPLPATTPASH